MRQTFADEGGRFLAHNVFSPRGTLPLAIFLASLLAVPVCAAAQDTSAAVVGQNLLDNHILQFSGTQFVPDQPTEIRRGVYGKVTWRY